MKSRRVHTNLAFKTRCCQMHITAVCRTIHHGVMDMSPKDDRGISGAYAGPYEDHILDDANPRCTSDDTKPIPPGHT